MHAGLKVSALGLGAWVSEASAENGRLSCGFLHAWVDAGHFPLQEFDEGSVAVSESGASSM